MDVAIGASGTTTTTSAATTEQERMPVAQETLPTVEQDSETISHLLESAMTRCYPSRTRKPPETDIELSCTVSFLGGRGI